LKTKFEGQENHVEDRFATKWLAFRTLFANSRRRLITVVAGHVFCAGGRKLSIYYNGALEEYLVMVACEG
jgi:hypothetical protein